MQFEKYYVDVVTPSGEGWVGYAARIGRTPVTLAALLHWTRDADGAAEHRRTIRGTAPVAEAAALHWQCAALGVDGTWASPGSGAFNATLWTDAGHAVRWEVLAPRAEVTLRWHDHAVTGLGYAERLSLDVAPWRLPIAELRWGRFVSATQSVVWIAWAHATPRQWLWHNGREVAPIEISERAVKWNGHTLSLEDSRTIRSGRLDDTALAGWARVRRFLPSAIRNFNETKWCARGSFTNGRGAPDWGWIIHERVRFR